MKTLLIAAAVLAATPAMAQMPADNDEITNSEVDARAVICLKLATGEYTAGQVVTALELDTTRKQRDFALQCRMFLRGVEIGQERTSNATRI